MDFWKGMICAEAFIYVVYLIMGMVIYHAQGNYTYATAYQGIPNSAYKWQTLGNAISFISALIAALLYGNIGIKVLYAAIGRDLLGFPGLDKKKGKLIWIGLGMHSESLKFMLGSVLTVFSSGLLGIGVCDRGRCATDCLSHDLRRHGLHHAVQLHLPAASEGRI
jgi:hypothetical protein